jgi:alkyldihydroxyacetonephosphate synthase
VRWKDATRVNPNRPSPVLHREIARLGVPFSTDEAVRRAASRDGWAVGAIMDYYGAPVDPVCAAVMYPRSGDEVGRVVRWAAAGNHPLVPRGGGTSLTGAAWVSRPDAVVLDLTRLGEVFEVDVGRRVVTVGAGLVGAALESRLQAQGLTTGHQPSSASRATVGGFLATRSSGPFSGKVGKIEDLVQKATWVDGSGDLHRDGEPGGLLDLVLGCEGTLGVFTQATLGVHPLPEHVAMTSALFDSPEAGLTAMRRVVQEGLAPAFLRLYDPSSAVQALRGPKKRGEDGGWTASLLSPVRHLGRKSLPLILRAAPLWNRLIQETLPRFWRNRYLLLAGAAGDSFGAQLCASQMSALMVACGGRDLGQEPARRWWEHRQAMFEIRPRVFASGAFADALDVSTTWSRMPQLVASVLEELAEHAFVMTHFSHAWHDGCSAHFTFAGAGRDLDDTLTRYHHVWNLALTAAARHQATISHHHGVGKLKRDFFASEHGAQVQSLLHLKRTLDPRGILNPGTLWPI